MDMGEMKLLLLLLLLIHLLVNLWTGLKLLALPQQQGKGEGIAKNCILFFFKLSGAIDNCSILCKIVPAILMV